MYTLGLIIFKNTILSVIKKEAQVVLVPLYLKFETYKLGWGVLRK